MPAAKVYKIHNALAKTLTGPNGVSKTQAVARASASLAEMRGSMIAVIGAEIEKLHRLALTCEGPLSLEAIESGMMLAGVLYNLAGAAGFDCLQWVSASLSDLLVVMEEGGSRCSDPILVHALAAMLVAPGMPAIGPAREAELLCELKGLVAFHRAALDRLGCSTWPVTDGRDMTGTD